MAAKTRADAIGGGERSSMRLAAFAGLVGCGLGIVGSGLVVNLFEAPGTAAPADEIAAFVQGHRSALLVGTLMTAVGVSLWLVFGAGVWLRLRREAGTESLACACFAVGLIGFATLILVGFTAFLILVYRDADVSDPRLLYDLTFGLLAMSGAPTAVALGAYASVARRSVGQPGWTALLAAVAAVAHLLLLASFVVETGFFSLEGQVITAIPATLFVWIIATSTVLLREGSAEQL